VTNTQMIFAILLPTITALTGILVSNGQFAAMSTRLMNLENKVSDLGQRVSHLEGSLGGK